MKYQDHLDAFGETLEFEYNQIMLVWCFQRVYKPIKFGFYFTQFNSMRSNRICSNNGCESNNMFALRAVVRQKPYTVVFLVLLMTVSVCAYQLRVFEINAFEASGQNFGEF